ncbi:hypothetical protein [Nocardioides aquiterrae]|uniref:Uncharacterized protein n=1 Tax=Nocardioides aquiterrae TaxID=203799 RepID=A0ABP4EZL1_9ACTN
MASTTSRNRSRLAVAAVSGVTTIAALSATGWLAGTAARSTAAQQADQQADQQAAPATPKPAVKARHARPARKVVLRQRPQRTHVTVRYVQAAPSAPVGSGGTVSQPVSQHSAPAPAPQHSAPAPQHSAPAPSSGS